MPRKNPHAIYVTQLYSFYLALPVLHQVFLLKHRAHNLVKYTPPSSTAQLLIFFASIGYSQAFLFCLYLPDFLIFACRKISLLFLY